MFTTDKLVAGGMAPSHSPKHINESAGSIRVNHSGNIT